MTADICDEDGHPIPPNTPPTPRESDRGPNDWTPYRNRTEFETADFLYRQNQMSAGNINILTSLWSATLAPHGAEPPFQTSTDLYNTVDATPLGDIPWESFTLKYDGDVPAGPTPAWMDINHEVWFRDPNQLVKNMLSNPDFNDECDFTPFQEYDAQDNHRFQNFMSGDWAWRQAVSFLYLAYSIYYILTKYIGLNC